MSPILIRALTILFLIVWVAGPWLSGWQTRKQLRRIADALEARVREEAAHGDD
jgi:hypothetical protein